MTFKLTKFPAWLVDIIHPSSFYKPLFIIVIFQYCISKFNHKLFIAKYYRQLSEDIKMKNFKIKTSFVTRFYDFSWKIIGM